MATPEPPGRCYDGVAVVDAGAVVAVDRGDVVEHGLDLGIEHLGRVRVGREVGVEDVADRHPDVRGGGRPASPVQHELVVEVGEQPLGAGLDDLGLSRVEDRFGLGEEIEDGQLLFGEPFADGALLFGGQGLVTAR